MFEVLLDKPRLSSVLQFYAAFTRFTNRDVRDIVTEIDLANKKHILLTIMICCFEASSQDQLLIQKINKRLNGKLQIFYVALTPFDCMSVGYFLAFALRAGELQSVELSFCSIDDHSLGLLLAEFSRYDEACPAGVLQSVTELDISGNNIGDVGIACLATVLQANTTMKRLDIGRNLNGIAVNGAKSLGKAISVNSSLEVLDIGGNSIGDEGVAHIANALQTNTTMKALIVFECGISDKGAESLARALSVNSSLEELNISFNHIGDEGVAHIANALQTNTTMKVLDVLTCGISCEGAESLARALSVNNSLEVLNISGNIIGDEVAHIANALQTNTTMTVLNVSNCDVSCKGAESLGRALSVNSSLKELYFKDTSIGDEGVAHIANALKANTTMKLLSVDFCDISDKGAESLARALTVNSSLEKLNIRFNPFGDDGIAHIANALQLNNILKSLMFHHEDIDNVTDRAALSLAAALTTNTSMEYMVISWSSTHPDTTLKKMAECIKKSTLRDLELRIVTPQPLGEPQVSLEEAREWYQTLEVGGKEFILSLEDSRLESLFLSTHYNLESSTHDSKSQIQMSLERAATSVNLKRKMNDLPEIKFII